MRQKLKIFLFPFLVFFLFWGFTLNAKGQDRDQFTEAIKAFDIFVKERMERDRAPGLSVGFMKDGIVWTKGYGYADLENKVLAKPESAYRLASITKTITAIAVLQLIEEEKIDLDAEIQAYVPYFPNKKWPVTVRHVLGHLSGISHYKNYAVEGRIKVHKNTKQALAIFQDFNLVAEPGTKYNYSSYGYNLLGACIEGASGMSYGDYIQKHIFGPLGMTDSRIDDPIVLIPNRVSGYRIIDGELKNSEYVDISSRFAGGGTRSTVIDLLKYAKGIIEGKLLEEDTNRQMFTSMAIREGKLTGYGMGWRVMPWRGHFQVGHGGSQPETRTQILIFPKENFAVSIASNLEGVNLMPYVRRLGELVLDEDMDSQVHVPSKEGQLIYSALEDLYSFGLSRFTWHEKPTAEDEEDLIDAFSYFNQHVSLEALNRNFKEAKEKISSGIHPAADRAFTKIGSFIASILRESREDKSLDIYHKKGPLGFLSDYIRISQEWPSDKKPFRFADDTEQLILTWEKDWNRVYTDSIQDLWVSIQMDFDALGASLLQTFSGAVIYPDFINEIANVGYFYLDKNKPDKARSIMNVCIKLYPGTVVPLRGSAAVHLWLGDTEEARTLLKKAFSLESDHTALSIRSLERLGQTLKRAEKTKEFLALADITAELYPENTDLLKKNGILYLRAGQKQKAIQYFQKALEIDPNLEDIKKRLEKLKKEDIK